MPRQCQEADCTKAPSYNYPNESQRLYCPKHKKDGMISVVRQKMCITCNQSTALFNYPEEEEMLYCAKDAKLGMINLKTKNKICVHQGCTTRSYYNYKGKKAAYCSKHKLVDMINVEAKTCQDCDKIPSFGFPNGKPTHCLEHLQQGMISLKNKCQSCSKQASFAEPGSNTPIYCGDHKKEGFVNIRKKYCEFSGCTKTAIFGNDGIRIYCVDHKDTDMINLMTRNCEYQNCTITANYGFDKATHCSSHKLDGMTQKYGYKCTEPNCTKGASFNFNGLKPAFCGKHKTEGMIDVKSKLCIISNCPSHATFGFPGKYPEFCAEHKKVGTKLQPTKKCNVKGCNDLAIFGTKDPEHCEKHKKPQDFNLLERICASCNLLNIIDEKGLCKYCNPSSWQTVRLAKQKEIEALFKKNNLVPISTDKTIDGGTCGKERPDFLFQGLCNYIVVEVDEDQHKSRACECEQTRMVNISQSLGMPTIFLRYNPDKYKVNGKTTDTFKATRHKNLINWTRKLIDLEPKDIETYGFLSVVHLYFDEFNPRKILWETMLECEN